MAATPISTPSAWPPRTKDVQGTDESVRLRPSNVRVVSVAVHGAIMSIKSISPYVFFNGNGHEAIAFYSAALGATTSHLMYWRELPAEYGGCAPEDEGRVMHAEIAIGPVGLLIADRPSSRVGPLGGNIDIHLGFSDAASLDAAYLRLAEGGEGLMAPHDAFWGERFATLRDRFGVTWVFTSPKV